MIIEGLFAEFKSILDTREQAVGVQATEIATARLHVIQWSNTWQVRQANIKPPASSTETQQLVFTKHSHSIYRGLTSWRYPLHITTHGEVSSYSLADAL